MTPIGMIAYGLMYSICIPSGFLLLTIYSLVSMHIVSSGTRESNKSFTNLLAEVAVESKQLLSPLIFSLITAMQMNYEMEKKPLYQSCHENSFESIIR